MRSLPLLFFLVLAAPALAENETARFLGPEADWSFARLRLLDPPMLDTGSEVAVTGSGSLSVRLLERDNERRFALTVEKEEALALVKLAVENDLAAVKIPDSAGIPDEHRMLLELENALGQRVALHRWDHDKVAAFKKVEEALRALEKKTEGKEPVFQGKADGFFRAFSGIEVTVSLSMNRPDPTFELVRPEDWEKVRELTTDLTAIERPKEKDPPAKYRGVLLAPRAIPGLPKWVSAQKGAVQVGDSPRDIVYKKDERGLEAWVLEEAKKRGIEVPK
jgi:hypothetical protein